MLVHHIVWYTIFRMRHDLIKHGGDTVQLSKILSVMLIGMACTCSTVFAQQGDGLKPANQKQAHHRQLSVAAWPGAYGAAQETTVLAPAAQALDVTLKRVEAERNKMVDADVLEVTQAELLKGCANGQLSKFDAAKLQSGTNQEPAREDFLTGAISECGVGSFAWSALVLVDRSKFKSRVPEKLADVFDTKRFKGKRAFIKKAENLFEFAAIATGSTPQLVYADLQDPLRLRSIMQLLEAMLPNIIWVETQSDALEKLGAGEAPFAMAYSGRAFRRIVAGNIVALWDVHVYDFTSWAISAKSQEPDLATAFIALATSPDYLVAHARLWPYGPMRKSAADMVGKHATLDIAIAPYIPTSSAHLEQGIRHDAAFWAKHGATLNARLTALLEGFPLGERVPAPTRRPSEPPTVAP